MRKIVKFILLGLFFGLSLYIGVYLTASRGDAFMYVNQKIMSSLLIETKIGKVNRVHIDLFGAYEEKYVGSDEWVAMSVEVTGVKASMNLDVKVKKMNEIWLIESVISQGDQITL